MSDPYETYIASSLKGHSLPPNLQNAFFEQRYKDLANHIDLLEEMYQEPFFLDDTFRVGAEDYLKYLVLRCETLLVKHESGEIMGAAVLAEVLPNRSAIFGGWIHPTWREGITRQRVVRDAMYSDVLDYAFTDLGLVKLTAKCAKINKSAARLLENIGFQRVGEMRFEGQFSGNLTDMLLYELVNPKFTEIIDGRIRKNKRTESVPDALRRDESHEPSDEPASRNESRRTKGKVATRNNNVRAGQQLFIAERSESDE